ncbi:MAG: Bax inhibitor-1/YccA family protein [Anaerolineae bacterium]|nr:Bax inhibitor-1/YccA family protein [Anaerolineae bacterium]
MGFSFGTGSSVESRPLPAGLSLGSVMRNVYAWMALALVVCFGVALLIGNAASAAIARGEFDFFLLNPVAFIVGIVAYLILAFALQPVIMRASVGVGAALFLFFAAVFGYMISTIFVVYDMRDIFLAFATTAGMFGVMSVIGFTTKTDLSRFANILFMALIGIIIGSLLNLLLRSEAIYWIITYISVIVFAGLTAYDTQWIKNSAGSMVAAGDVSGAARLALIGAFHLFLDFMNLFLTLLRIFGSSRD